MNAAIYEVVLSLVEALVIVTLVVFIFLGSVRSSLIPTVAIPLSLVGTFIILLALGYSINLLTLLALVLAIGLVVDDAIIVVENVNRHLEDGMAPVPAAITAARELGWPIVAMTVVLAAVYVPIGFQGGLTGALFAEFAFALVGAVTVSGVVALTLSPMLCSRLLKAHDPLHRGWEEKLTYYIDRAFNWLQGAYERRLHGSLNYLPVTVVFSLLVLGSIYFLFITAHTELAPQEDQGVLLSLSNSAPNATLKQRKLYSHEIFRIFFEHPETEHVFQIDVPGPVHFGHGIEALGAADRHPPTSCSRSCSKRWQRLPDPASSSSSLRRCRAASVCRFSSSSEPPNRSSGCTISRRTICARRSRAECSSFSTAI